MYFKMKRSQSSMALTQARPVGKSMFKRRRLPMRMRLYKSPTTTHVFRATQFAQVATGTAPGTTQFFGTAFSLASVPNSTSYTGLFDQYRINKIELKFIQSYGNSPTVPGSVSQPVIYIVTDFDDAAAPASINAIIERNNHRILSLSGSQSVQKHTLVPRVSSFDINTAAGSVASSVKARPWLNCSFPTVAHNGVKYAIDNLLTNAQVSVYITYYFECRATL